MALHLATHTLLLRYSFASYSSHAEQHAMPCKTVLPVLLQHYKHVHCVQLHKVLNMCIVL